MVFILFLWIPAFANQAADEVSNEGDTLEKLYSRIEKLRNEFKFTEALPLAEKALGLRKKAMAVRETRT